MPIPKDAETHPITIDLNDNKFSPNQLGMFSPFKVTKIEAFEATSKQKFDTSTGQPIPNTGGRKYTAYRVSVRPQQNNAVEIEVLLFKYDFDKIRGLLQLYGGSDHTLISMTLNESTKPVSRIWTARQA